jgi:hypothetical protein
LKLTICDIGLSTIQDESIQSYLPAVRKTLEETFRNAMDQFARIGDRSPASRSAGQMMLKIISILGRPLAPV